MVINRDYHSYTVINLIRNFNCLTALIYNKIKCIAKVQMGKTKACIGFSRSGTGRIEKLDLDIFRR